MRIKQIFCDIQTPFPTFYNSYVLRFVVSFDKGHLCFSVPPEVKAERKFHHARLGDNVTLVCIVFANPQPKVGIFILLYGINGFGFLLLLIFLSFSLLMLVGGSADCNSVRIFARHGSDIAQSSAAHFANKHLSMSRCCIRIYMILYESRYLKSLGPFTIQCYRPLKMD
jgi:hypothetical protein